MQEIFISLLFLLSRWNILGTTSHMVVDSQNAQAIFWLDDENILVNQYTRYFKYNVLSREVYEFDEKEESMLFGKNYICGWFNKEIRSEDEYSTRLTKDDYSGTRILDIELKPTLEVIECEENIVLRTLPPIAEDIFIQKDELFPIRRYMPRVLSPNLNKLLLQDDFGNYWITEFRF
jgi:hypothetical protein